MPEPSGRALSVTGLFRQRDAQRRRDKEAREQPQRSKGEELVELRQRLRNCQLTDEMIYSGLDRIRRAVERGETELMIASFPSTFCSDDGRVIINAGAPPINKPSREEVSKQADEPEWLKTPPPGAHHVYDFWKQELKPGGFGFSARVISYPSGIPGDVGLFLSWPKGAVEANVPS